jgi:Cdc6-like AAA superfamily ATPase/DNA polymerase III delta prime subunit
MTQTIAPSPRSMRDQLIEAYLNPEATDPFTGVVAANQIWQADPFDVEKIHQHARQAYLHLLDRVSQSQQLSAGQFLLILGPAGSGKTHLLRALRVQTHQEGRGYCAYLTLNTRVISYTGYILRKIVESLEQPYLPDGRETGLSRLVNRFIQELQLDANDRDLLTSNTLEGKELADHLWKCANRVVRSSELRKVGVEFAVALLATQTVAETAAISWLRGEELPPYQRELLGGIPQPQTQGDASLLKIIENWGLILRQLDQGALVLLVDQLEELVDVDKANQDQQHFNEVVNTLITINEQVPNSFIVLSCLKEHYTTVCSSLPRPKLDRLDKDHKPVELTPARTLEEIQEIVKRRLEYFFEKQELLVDPEQLVVFYGEAALQQLVRMSARQVVSALRSHREKSIEEGRFVDVPPWPAVLLPDDGSNSDTWNQLWENARTQAKLPDAKTLLDLLTWAIGQANHDLAGSPHFGVTKFRDHLLSVEKHTGPHGSQVDKFYVALCNAGPQRGSLINQLNQVVNAAGADIPIVFARSTEFPRSGQAHDLLKRHCTDSGSRRKVVIANNDWRAMAAFREFEQQHRNAPGFAEWRKQAQPLAGLKSMREILGLNQSPPAESKLGTTGDNASSTNGQTPPPPPPITEVQVGQTRELTPQPVCLPVQSLCTHAAFLGGSGSGKTTAALALIEKLLEAGVPAILVDRKGDLSRYADPQAYASAATGQDTTRAARLAALASRLDVRLYTPGESRGRPLGLSMTPPDLASLSPEDRNVTIAEIAEMLGSVLGYNGKSEQKMAVLEKAIQLLAEKEPARLNLKTLCQVIHNRERSLVEHFSTYKDSVYSSVATDIETLERRRGSLFNTSESLDLNMLLGRGPFARPGKTALTIINTQFLKEDAVQIWLSQFLSTVRVWMVKNPSSTLQAVLFFDEADQYLPAVGKPPTKGPMENLLKRGRSAGVGLFLATQSPGDFDYKCRDQISTWYVGGIKETRAKEKIKPLFERKPHLLDKVATQTRGQFMLRTNEDVLEIAVEPCLIQTQQLEQDAIMNLARQTASGNAPAAVSR